jgi:hypothetical protein
VQSNVRYRPSNSSGDCLEDFFKNRFHHRFHNGTPFGDMDEQLPYTELN